MKRSLRTFLLFAACAAAFASCSKDRTETATPDPKSATFRFSAVTDPETDQTPTTAATRTVFDENYQLQWCTDDAIGLYIASATPTDNAEATPDLTVSPTIFEASVNSYTVGDKVYAYYPYNANNTSTTVALTIPAAQESPALDRFNGAYNPLVAIPTAMTVEDQNYAMIEKLCFRQTAAMIAFNIYTSSEEYVDETIESISYTNNGEENLAGTFSVDLTAVPARGELSVGEIENGSKNIEVTLAEQGYLLDVNDMETNIVYMSVLPGEYEGTVVVTTDKATYTFPSKKALPLQRAYVRKIALNLANAERQLRPFYEIKGVMGSTATKNAWTGWTFENDGTGNDIFGIRLGTGSKQGIATSPAINNFPEKIEVAINAVAWDGSSENTILTVSLLNEDETVYAQRNIEIAKQSGFSGNSPAVPEANIMSAANRRTVLFYAGSGTKKIRIEAQNAANNRFALAYVAITATDADIIVPPTISADDITGISEEGATDATFDFTVENDREYTATAEFDGTVVTAASIENRTVTYTVAPNTGDAREGWITISLNDENTTKKTIKVAQDKATIIAAGLDLPFNDNFEDLTGNGTPVDFTSRNDAAGNPLYSQSDKTYQFNSPCGLRLGTSSAIGYITTTELNLSQEFSVIVSARAWSNDATALKITAGDQTKTTDTNLSEEFKSYIFYFDADKSNATVRFEPATTKKRVIIKSIQIVAGRASLPPTFTITSNKTISVANAQTDLTTTYSIQNPVAGLSVTAASDVNWIYDFQYSDGEVKYTVAANDGENAESRTGIVTLSYGDTTPQTITIKQAGANGGAEQVAGTPWSYAFGLIKDAGITESSEAGTITINQLEWSYKLEAANNYFGGTTANGMQIGSSKKPMKTFTLESSAYTEYIQTITVEARANATTTLTVYVNGQQLGDAVTLTNTLTTHTFTSSSLVMGDIKIIYAASSSATSYLKTLAINPAN